GIGLRGYAQQDPLNEFRKEAFALYEELRSLIRHQVASTIFRVSVTRQAPSAPQPMPMVRPIAAGVGTSSVTGSGGFGGDGRGTAAAVAGATAAIARGGLAATARGLPSGPVMRGMRESLGDQRIASGGGRAR